LRTTKEDALRDWDDLVERGTAGNPHDPTEAIEAEDDEELIDLDDLAESSSTDNEGVSPESARNTGGPAVRAAGVTGDIRSSGTHWEGQTESRDGSAIAAEKQVRRQADEDEAAPTMVSGIPVEQLVSALGIPRAADIRTAIAAAEAAKAEAARLVAESRARLVALADKLEAVDRLSLPIDFTDWALFGENYLEARKELTEYLETRKEPTEHREAIRRDDQAGRGAVAVEPSRKSRPHVPIMISTNGDAETPVWETFDSHAVGNPSQVTLRGKSLSEWVGQSLAKYFLQRLSVRFHRELNRGKTIKKTVRVGDGENAVSRTFWVKEVSAEATQSAIDARAAGGPSARARPDGRAVAR